MKIKVTYKGNKHTHIQLGKSIPLEDLFKILEFGFDIKICFKEKQGVRK